MQVKKEAVRLRILAAARDLFADKGYAATSINQIAARAGLSPATLYVYFPSKLDIAFAVFGPWMDAQLDALEEAAAAISDPEERIRFVLRFLWQTLPAVQGNFFRNFIQAIALSAADSAYKPTILSVMQQRLSLLLSQCLDESQRPTGDVASLTNLAIMAFDGFVINAPLQRQMAEIDATIEMVVRHLMGFVDTAQSRSRSNGSV